MKTRALAWLLTSACLLATGASIASPATQAPYRLAYQRRLSGPTTVPAQCQRYHDELYPQLITFPDRPLELTTVYEQDAMMARVAATSQDGGRTWRRHPIPAATACSGGHPERTHSQNPSVAGGRSGKAYFGVSWYGDSGGLSAQDVVVERSSDGGSTWADGRNAPGDYPTDIAVAADPDHSGHLWATWSDFAAAPTPSFVGVLPFFGRVVFATSADGGRTFSDPVTIFAPTPDSTVLNKMLMRETDGTLLEEFEEVTDANGIANAVAGIVGDSSLQPLELTSYVMTSRDGGATWAAPVKVGQHEYLNYGNGDYNPGPIDGAVGPGARAVLAWAATPSDGKGAIVIATSRTGGRTWTAPFTAITAQGNAFEPAVSIAPNGDLGLFWYELSSATTGGDTRAEAWFATSSDGGHAWSKILLSGPFSIDASVEPALNGTYDDGTPLGFYQDVSAVGSGFGVAYTVGPPLARDGRTDVRFARIEQR